MAIKDISDFQALLSVAAYSVHWESWGLGMTIIYEPFPALRPPEGRARGWHDPEEALMALTGRSRKECQGAIRRAQKNGLMRFRALNDRGWDALVEELTPRLESLDLEDALGGAERAPAPKRSASRL